MTWRMPLVGKSKAVEVLPVPLIQSTRVWRGPFWSYARLLPSHLQAWQTGRHAINLTAGDG